MVNAEEMTQMAAQQSTPSYRGQSIERKINLGVLVTFLLVFVTTLIVTARSEERLVMGLVQDQTRKIADAYLDSLNVLMLSGAMANREMLRAKILEREEILDFRVVRHQAISQIYGPGLDHEQPVDELDRQALQGDLIEVINTDSNGVRSLTLNRPVYAEKDYLGTNCLLCHVVEEKSVLGAIRVTFSLAALDKQLATNLWTVAIAQTLLFGFGFALILGMLRFFILKRIHSMREVMGEVEKSNDLGRRLLPMVDSDELGQLAVAFNSMMQRISVTFKEVRQASQLLTRIADDSSQIARQAAVDIQQQKEEIDQIAEATHRMVSNTEEIAVITKQTAETSARATNEAQESALISIKAMGSISNMVNEVVSSESAIRDLGNKINKIEHVLKVIKTISHQTNLLALNAAIEAARAGEAGRGFAVVAEEVQLLASKTNQSADNIKQMIEGLQADSLLAIERIHKVNRSAHLSDEHMESSAESLGAISGDVSLISSMNQKVATATQEQNSVAREIDTSLWRIRESIETSTQGAKRSAQGSEEILRLIRQLDRLMEAFRH
ncbi:MAG: methyl-accepting chemotaxis protein [Gammaproteobacteria bacterium]|nr:methyl-accepting chemotaxis protein [Gammaproteobacteria bacterium]